MKPRKTPPSDPASADMARRRGSLALLSIAALAGAGTMVVELAAVRVLAPWFGTSAAVWTNVIGVVLLALALGYLLGSRLAARPAPARSLGLALLIAAAVIACLPAAAAPVAEAFRPAGGTLDRAADLLLWGSLAAAFALFAPGAVALGCVGPLAVECVQQRTEVHAGTAGGAVLFASTLGSLAGTFGTTHVLVPELGVALSFYLASATLAAAGLGALALAGGERRGPESALVLVLVLGGAAAAGFGSFQPPRPAEGLKVLEEALSPYQALRVVEGGEGEARFRQLQVDEGLDSFQSVWRPEPGLLGPGYYYDYFALPLGWSAPEEGWRVMVLGLGAGSAWRVLEGVAPAGLELVLHGVELDPEAVALARRWMDLPADDARHRSWVGQDARAVLATSEERYDQLVLDTYAHQMEVPAHLSTIEFFRELREHLLPGGWLTINIGGFGLEDPVVRAIAGTAAEAFGGRALVLRVPFSRNCVAYLRRDAEPAGPGDSGWAIHGNPELAGLLGPLELEGASGHLGSGAGEHLTDDRNPIEVLQRESIALAARRLARLGGGERP